MLSKQSLSVSEQQHIQHNNLLLLLLLLHC